MLTESMRSIVETRISSLYTYEREVSVSVLRRKTRGINNRCTSFDNQRINRSTHRTREGDWTGTHESFIHTIFGTVAG
jgi:hypothetical protein